MTTALPTTQEQRTPAVASSDLLDANRAKRLMWKKKWRESAKGRAYQKKAHAEWRAKHKEVIAKYRKQSFARPEYQSKIPHYKRVRKMNFVRKHSLTWGGFTNRETWKYATMAKEFWDDTTDAIVMDTTKTKREIAKTLGRSLASIKMRRYRLTHGLASNESSSPTAGGGSGGAQPK